MVKQTRVRKDDFILKKEKALLSASASFVAAPRVMSEPLGRDPVRPAAAGWTATAAGEERGPLGSLPIRSAARRRWAADLTGPALAGLVLHGVGGIGKSTLASQIVSRVGHLEPERATAVMRGEVSADGVLGAVASALRGHPAVSQGSGQAQSVRAAGRTDLPWAHRLALLREMILGQVPVLLVLDDFDDNLTPDSGGWTVRDPVLAELIASWAGNSHRGRLLITCRHPFTSPATAGPPLGFRHVGPLSRSGAFELARSLPALGRLGDHELEQAWRLLGGHPQAMKYLDSLLVMGEAGFPEVARRLELVTGTKTGDPARAAAAPPTELAPAVAETTALDASEFLLGELFDQLSPAARELLVRTLDSDGPAGPDLPAPPVPLVAECAVAGLLTADPGGSSASVAVPRWTADQLRHLVRARRDGVGHPAGRRSRRLPAAALAGLLAATAAGAFALGHPGSSPARARAAAPAAAAVLDEASALRSRAAAWVAQQISPDAIVACDPDMCAALLAHRVAPGNLLDLAAAAADPLGSDVVVATGAVRSQFGARLASVYAPAVLASFGSGRSRIEVRAVAPDGAAAYRASLASDLAARRDAGRQLASNPHIRVSAAARRELEAGQVDSRLLTTLAALAEHEQLQVSAFGDSGPGASPGVPLRSAAITAAGPAVVAMLSYVRAQRPPYLPARSLIVPGTGGRPVLRIVFAAPSPEGLLQGDPAR